MNESSRPAAASSAERTPVTIKKYANRRLYNTATSSYVTLQSLSTMVKAGADFVVYDAKTGEDITRAVLTHIIVEEEAKGQKLLPVSFLRHLISFYGDSLQVLVPRYLEHTMQAFARNQEQMRDYMRETLDGLMPFGQLEEMSKQNISIFETAMKMFSPFYSEEEEASQVPDRAAAQTPNEEIEELRGRLNKIQQQLDELVAQQRSE
ncbi:MAG: polyhydroxyalkanoate synthesis repressor PhaR [Rhodospirillales bacterium]|nr:MAG: polyhydroxyalkanoate synthesis repressor PhaR [Rhodospirillales bacterium]